jgi:Dynamin central region
MLPFVRTNFLSLEMSILFPWCVSSSIHMHLNQSVSFWPRSQCEVRFANYAIDSSDDVDNQAAYSIAREHDENGLRTIGTPRDFVSDPGVLTKADMVTEGEHERWLQILTGRSHKLKMGWFVTCMKPSLDKDGNSSRDKVRFAQGNYFKSHHIWNLVDKKKTGTDNLTETLGEILSQMIQNTYIYLRTGSDM